MKFGFEDLRKPHPQTSSKTVGHGDMKLGTIMLEPNTNTSECSSIAIDDIHSE